MEVLTLKTKYSVRDGVVGGIIGGIAMGLTAMLSSLVLGKGLLEPIILTGYAFQPYVSNPEMSGSIFFKAVAIHMAISLLGGLIFIFAANTFLNRKHLWFWGIVLGGFMWSLAILGGIQTLNSTMAAHLNMNHIGFFLGYLAYGAVLGGYVGKRGHTYQNHEQ